MANVFIPSLPEIWFTTCGQRRGDPDTCCSGGEAQGVRTGGVLRPQVRQLQQGTSAGRGTQSPGGGGEGRGAAQGASDIQHRTPRNSPARASPSLTRGPLLSRVTGHLAVVGFLGNKNIQDHAAAPASRPSVPAITIYTALINSTYFNHFNGNFSSNGLHAVQRVWART